MKEIAEKENIRFFSPMEAPRRTTPTCDLSDGEDFIISVDNGHLTDGGVVDLAEHIESFCDKVKAVLVTAIRKVFEIII